MRLIALSDEVLGSDENYGVLFESAVEAIREHPGTYFRGVADTFWDFLMQAPLREDVAPREQTAPEAPPPTFEQDGVVLPNPGARCSRPCRTGSSGAPPTTSTPARSTAPRSCGRTGDAARYREVVAQVRSWDADLPSREECPSCRAPEPDHAALPAPAAVAPRRGGRARGPASLAARTVLALWLAAGLVLLVHAVSQGVAPEFALPLYPVFIVTALVALSGDRGLRGARRPRRCASH